MSSLNFTKIIAILAFLGLAAFGFFCTACKDIDAIRNEMIKAYDKKDYKTARELALSIQNDAIAKNYLGDMYYKGQGVPKDYGQALDWYEAARNTYAGHAIDAMRDKGEIMYATQLRLYRKPAEQGDAGAQCILGDLYLKGRGVDRNLNEAEKLFRKAAEQGNANAQYQLGTLYYTGVQVPQDYGLAMSLYRKAAEQGVAAAQYELGNLYYTGDGVPQDYAQAANWYRKAAEQGVAEAQAMIGQMYGIGHGVAKNYKLAVDWLSKAAEQENGCGQFGLGFMYENGYGVTQNIFEARNWYEEAAEQGDPHAKEALKRLKTQYDIWVNPELIDDLPE